MDGSEERLLVGNGGWRWRLNHMNDGLGQCLHQDVEDAGFKCDQIPDPDEIGPGHGKYNSNEDPNDGKEKLPGGGDLSIAIS
jgi:hypothetical protein